MLLASIRTSMVPLESVDVMSSDRGNLVFLLVGKL